MKLSTFNLLFCFLVATGFTTATKRKCLIQDYLGLSLDLSCDGELEKSESDLGNSVFVQNLSVSSDPEETEENDLGKSLSDVDVLGNSLCQEDNFDPMFTEFDSENLLSSTPVKKNSNTCNENEVEDLESVQAIIKSSPVERFILEELSPRSNKLLAKSLRSTHIQKLMKQECKCGLECFKPFTFKSVRYLRYRYWTKSRQMRSQWLIQTLKNSKKNGKYTYMDVDSGERVCSVAFRLLYNINKNFLVKCNKNARRNAVASDVKKAKGMTVKSVMCVGWIENYVTACADRMPDKGAILLPYKTRKSNVYNIYKSENTEPVSKSTFQYLWRHHFPQVKVKQANAFSMCNICASLGRRLELEVCPIKRAKVMKLRKEHNQRQMLERKCYYLKREESRKNPGSYLSLIIDGMDQSKSSLPHIVGRRAKVVNPADLLKTHITGVISHGHNTFSTFLDIGQYPHDPNLTMNILLKTLLRIAQKENNRLPPVLYLQADNCYRENKNRFVLAFCELLVKERIFNEVIMSFLFVGHTHEDVDAGFSKIAEKLRKTDAETVEELKKLLPDVQELEGMLDIKAWLSPHLATLSHHSGHHHFRFAMVDGKPAGFYKMQQHLPWTQMEGSLFNEYPRRRPQVLKPDYTRINLETLKKQIDLMSYLFKDAITIEWWTKYIEKLQRGKSEKSVSFIEKLPRQPITIQETQSSESVVPVEVEKMISKETDTAQGIVQRHRKKQPQQSSKKQKQNHQSRRRKSVILYTRRSFIIIYIYDEKKHIWFQILYTVFLASVLECYILLLIFYIFIMFLQNLYGLINLMKLIHWLWLNILMEHMATARAEVNMNFLTDHILCY